jgi:transcriptional regulator with XRE-family HTH domain
MSIASCEVVPAIDTSDAASIAESEGKPLHRLQQVRQQQRISARTVAQRLDVSVSEVRSQEDALTDLSLSLLYQWQQALDVPVVELLVDHQLNLSPPVLQRAQMVRLMKTVASIVDHADNAPVQRLSTMLLEQMLEIMPELKDVGPWQASGSHRTLDEAGAAYDRRVTVLQLNEAV